jgi:enamine deaminase RidA (YjgF/YER057c/UK114 family)
MAFPRLVLVAKQGGQNRHHAPAIERGILMTREYINPPGVPKRAHYTRVLTIDKPSKLVYIAGQTPVDDKYQPVHAGDVRAQYIAVLAGLTLQLKAAGAKVMNDPTVLLPWDKARPSPSTLIGVTALSNPGFLIEVEIVAVV